MPPVFSLTGQQTGITISVHYSHSPVSHENDWQFRFARIPGTGRAGQPAGSSPVALVLSPTGSSGLLLCPVTSQRSSWRNDGGKTALGSGTGGHRSSFRQGRKKFLLLGRNLSL